MNPESNSFPQRNVRKEKYTNCIGKNVGSVIQYIMKDALITQSIKNYQQTHKTPPSTLEEWSIYGLRSPNFDLRNPP